MYSNIPFNWEFLAGATPQCRVGAWPGTRFFHAAGTRSSLFHVDTQDGEGKARGLHTVRG